MDIGRVTGNVLSTIRNQAMSSGVPLLLVEFENGGREAVVDTVRAGVGDQVLVSRGTAARLATGDPNSAIDAAITAIVDVVDVQSET